MRPMDMLSLLQRRALDPELAALLWLLADGGVPLVVAGPAQAATRSEVAAAVLAINPSLAWVLIDADEDPLQTERLAALLRGGVGLGVTLAADDLEAVIDGLVAAGLPEDGVRRLGVVIILEDSERRLRCRVVHYLRPTERDAQGHVQRRPPAVLAAWDDEADGYEHYAWGITPELASRLDRSQADLEERQHDRAVFLQAAAADDAAPEAQQARVARYLESEPPRVAAPAPEDAKPSPFSGGLTDPDPHVH
jgi:hypothetical protein